jgi:hypothetical protein
MNARKGIRRIVIAGRMITAVSIASIAVVIFLPELRYMFVGFRLDVALGIGLLLWRLDHGGISRKLNSKGWQILPPFFCSHENAPRHVCAIAAKGHFHRVTRWSVLNRTKQKTP